MPRRFVLATAVAVALYPLIALAGGALNLDKNGAALKGHDPVAYFTQKQPVKGRADLRVEHGGATYFFASPEHRAAFEAEPAKYVPAYGGYCAYGVAQGAKADIDPAAFTVVDGKLYMNLDTDIQQRWRRDIPGFIKKADANWPALERK
ncbi:MAG TPA: YHS domain-containing (seleno)protein [Burkholderiaceae bacterium]|nr:YHS domain-containing (seleno)protein [Burkholderiaceae bacterium]